MDDLMNKLQSVLNDEESMNQIKELANMLTAEMPQNDQNTQSNPNNPPAPAPLQNSGAQNGQNNMSDLSALLQSLTGGGQQSAQPQNAPAQNALPNFDMGKMMQLGQVIQSANKNDKNIDLLLALRPLLKEENQVKIDRLIKIFRLFAMYPALKESGLLGGDLFGIF